MAGASKSTVSLVLNGKPGIGAEARERVLRAAEALGYKGKHPASDKKGVAMIRLLWIVKHGHILNSDHRGFITEYIEGLEKAAYDQGFRLEIMSFDSFEVERVQEAMGSGASGIVILATELDEQDMALLGKVPVPKVFIDSQLDFLSHDFVDMDNTASVHRIVEYLSGWGHQRIGLVQSLLKSENFILREKAFFQALTRCRLEFHPEDLFQVDPTYQGAAQNLTEAFHVAASLPTALFCVNDVIAYGALRALDSLGFSVPDQVSIIGFDNLPSNDYMTPPLTSMMVSKHAIGSRAFQLLKARMDDPGKPSEKVLVGGDLVIRKSVRNLLPFNNGKVS